MTTHKETLTLALEALTIADNIALVGAAYTPRSIDLGLQKISSAITAIKEALAQPEQEPYGLLNIATGVVRKSWEGTGYVGHLVEVYTTPPQPEQEPVAFLTNRRQRLNVEFNATGLTLMPKSVDWKIPLYTTTPQRKTLTDEMLLSAAQSCLSPQQYDHFDALLENDPDAHNRLARAIDNERGK